VLYQQTNPARASLGHNERNQINRMNKTNRRNSVPKVILPPALKAVTFMVPAHLADLIEATRGQLVGQWEDWATSAAQQAVNESSSFKQCAREFESLLVDSNWEFEDADDRAQFMAPLLKALKTAHTQHKGTDEGIAPALMN